MFDVGGCVGEVLFLSFVSMANFIVITRVESVSDDGSLWIALLWSRRVHICRLEFTSWFAKDWCNPVFDVLKPCVESYDHY